MSNKSTITSQEVQDWVMKLYLESEKAITPAERKDQEMYATMIRNKNDKVFLSKMLDESSQIRHNKKLAKRIKRHIDTYGVPEFFNGWYRFLFKTYTAFGHHFDFIAIPIIKWQLREQTAAVIINEARPHLTKHLADRTQKKIGQNVNLLGEVVIGNGEADKRYRHYLEALEAPDINYISVKISGIYAQLHALNYEESFPELVRRMSALYQKAIDFPYIDENGVRRPKFINLDMEEYKDTHMTMRVFKETLAKPEFKNLEAGIVIQAYLPDAWDFQTELLEFAKERVEDGGAHVKMRLVKGANLEMETVISSLRGWPNPILPSKVEVDANYLSILERAMLPENAKVCHVGVASHNFYSIAYAHLLGEKNGTSYALTFEMLEGMANHLWRAQSTLGNQVILYTPVVKNESFLNAISYLVRRMDENTAPENFLAHSFGLKPDTKEWKFLEGQFAEAFALKDKISHVNPRQAQDRRKPYEGVEASDKKFRNEPDTDFDLRQNQLWAEEIVKKWKKSPNDKPEVIPTQIGSEEVVNERQATYKDRCQDDEVTVCTMSQANAEQTRRIIEIADTDPAGWRKKPLAERRKILYKAADNLAAMRGDLIGCMCAVTGKTITEGDVEVSEAVDFARFYPDSMFEFEALKGVTAAPKGTILVISPWNFPCAIPVGGVASALASGNTVILKPATVAAPISWEFAKAFWDAGVPKEALHVVITDRESLGILTTAPQIKHIVLTGGTDTAQNITRNNPITPLSAETGGKNAIIVTAAADRDKAIMNAVASAFGNAGQKCSACSLMLVEASVYDDPEFRSKMIDCAGSLKTGSVWDTGNIVGPMITNNNDKLLEAIGMMEPGEEWLLAPRFTDKLKYALAPTIKWGVRPEYFAFRTELFGPMLSVVRVKDLHEAVTLVNSLDYGLTSGLQSLDETEQKYWKDHLEAGNLYINRGTTGAIVNRQPFGGMKLSAFGGGIKAGGPNYVSCFLYFTDTGASAGDWRTNYKTAYEKEFKRARDVNNLYGEQNLFRYLPLRSMGLRLFEGDTLEQAEKIASAAQLVGTPLTISVDPSDPKADELARGSGYTVKRESLNKFIDSMSEYERFRTCTPDIPRPVYEAAAVLNKYIATASPVSEGRVELLHYIKEQSITYEYHRYGSITEIPELE
ncbi:MAG: bifunctional proline dehydrogenase/L-glutamate gamma-semialdehyde dehydrogenase [Rikenellaceae bacterium]|nr:bifunctional proline dehydrogenase/L-glutamate gamma-semialdehyde dehydrogenase [Rikenellaceae bacterium]MCL2691969.1 bifunctional proline dehydrogenase/L-glutamate gamma-semialdehyde dehydrogenase [Rikenellaceae bacterium]